MCEMLTYLHEQTPSLVHRDFTPDNLILEDSGKLKLIDFNVVHQSNTNKTSATIVGKHSYMPPEQFAGRPVPQSDLYALGATIYYLLSGEDPEAFSQSFLPSKRPDLAPRWAEVISRCTALSLAERAQSARELSLMLDFVGEENESLPEAMGGRDLSRQDAGSPGIELRSRQDAGAPGIEHRSRQDAGAPGIEHRSRQDAGAPGIEHRSRQDAGAPGIEPVSVSINEPEAIEANQPNKKELEEAWQS
jgi:serine/threonine protein kinase